VIAASRNWRLEAMGGPQAGGHGDNGAVTTGSQERLTLHFRLAPTGDPDSSGEAQEGEKEGDWGGKGV
jgi:hypothetical protein